MRTSPSRWLRLVVIVGALVLAVPSTSSATHIVPAPPDCDEDSFLVTLNVPGSLQHVICSGDTVGTFEFPGIPDGIGVMPGPTEGTIDVFVNAEESEVPFPATGPAAAGDYQDSSVTKLTVDTSTGAVLAAEVAIPATANPQHARANVSVALRPSR